MNPNVNPVYGYNCYNIANNQFLMWNKDLIKRDVEAQQERQYISHLEANQNKEIFWRSGVGNQQVITYLSDEHNQKTQRVNMILYNIKNSSKYHTELREAATFLLSDKSIDLTCLFPYIEYFQSKTQNDKEIFLPLLLGYRHKSNSIESLPFWNLSSRKRILLKKSLLPCNFSCKTRIISKMTI